MTGSSSVWIWELDYEESWVLKNWCFWTVVLEKTFESPLNCKEIQPVHPKGDQSWVFIGRTDVEAETPILWPPHVKSWLIGKDSDAGRDWGAGGEGDNRGWDVWMASPTRWTWIWVNSRSWWWTGRPGGVQSTESQSRTWLSDWPELNPIVNEEITILHKLFQKIKKGLLPNSYYKATIVPKPGKEFRRKSKSLTNLSHESRCKIS